MVENRKRTLLKRMLSVILTFVMIFSVLTGIVPGTSMRALATETYPLYIGGVQVTSDTATDTTAHPTWSYDVDTNTLTLNGFVYSASEIGIDYQSTADNALTIVLAGNNTITSTANTGINSIKNMVITSTNKGKLSVTGSGTHAGISAYGGSVTISGNAIVETSGGNEFGSYGIQASGDNGTITINGSASVTATGGGAGLFGQSDITISGSAIVEATTATGSAGIKTYGNLLIENDADVVASGSGRGISVLKDATISDEASVSATGGSNGIYAGEGLTIGADVTLVAVATGGGEGASAIAGTVTNAVAGAGWADAAGTTGQADIAVSTTGQDLSSYKKIQFPAVLPHKFNYAAGDDSNEIIATCKDDCPYNDHSTVTLTLNAPENLTYNGQPKEATITTVKPTNFDGDIKMPKVYYYNSKGKGSEKISGAALEGAPTEVGNYVAQITCDTQIAVIPFSIEPCPLVVDWKNTSKVYNGSTQAPEAVLIGVAEGDVVNAAVTVTGGAKDVGYYIANCSLEGADAGKYTISDQYKSHIFNITPKVVGLTWGTDTTFTYDGKDHVPSVNLTGICAGDSVMPVVTGSATAVGSHTATVARLKGTSASNYELPDDADKEFTIKKADLSGVRVSLDNWTYGQTPKVPSIVGNKDGANVTYTYKPRREGDSAYTTTVPSLAGDYIVRAVVDPTAGYNGTTVTNSFTINKAEPNLNLTLAGWVYDQEAKTPVLTGNVENGEVTYTYYVDESCTTPTSTANSGAEMEGAVPVWAGTYTLKAEVAETANYYGKQTTVKFVIDKDNSVVTTAPETVLDLTYDGKEHELITSGVYMGGTIKYALGRDGDTAPLDAAFSETVPKGINAGKYFVWYKVFGDKNHNNTLPVVVETVIAKKELEITANETFKIYGDEDPELTFDCDKLIEGNTLNGNPVREPGENAGEYAILKGTLDAGNNYEIKFVEATFYIDKADASTTKPTANNRTYDKTEKELITSGTPKGGTIKYALGTDATNAPEDTAYSVAIPKATNAGKYYIWYKVFGNENHNDSEPAFVVTDIARKAVVVSGVTADSKVYDGKTTATIITDEAEFDGIIDGDELFVTSTGEFEDANVGADKTVNITGFTLGGTSADNYVVAQSGNQAVTQGIITNKPITVKADDKSSVYGEDDVPLTYTVTGLVEGDSIESALNVKLVREEGEDAGTYAITEDGISSDNYEISFIEGEYVIEKAAQAEPEEELTADKASGVDVNDGKINGFDADKFYQYSSDEGANWTDISDVTSITVRAGTYQIRYAGNENYNEGEATSVTVEIKEEQESPEDLEVVNVSKENATNGQIVNVDDTMEYSTDGKETWIAVPENADKINGLSEGVVYVRYIETEDYNASEPIELVIGVASNTDGDVVLNKKDEEATVDTNVTDADATNIKEFARTQEEKGNDVKVSLEITPKNEQNVDKEFADEIADVIDEVLSGVEADNIEKEYLVIDVSKYVNNNKTKLISDTGTPIEIKLTYDKSKVYNPMIVRTHNDNVTVFTKLDTKPAKTYTDGTYYVDKENGVIYFYSRYFSDYALIYTNVQTYNVKLDMGDGTTISKIVEKDGKIELSTDIVKTGYTFKGWYSDSKYANAWNLNKDTVKGDIILYAKWEKNAEETKPDENAGTSTDASTEVLPEGTPQLIITDELKANAKIALDEGFKVSQTGSKINIKWGKVAEADGYDVYCEYSFNDLYTPIKTISNNSTTSVNITKIDNYKIDLKDDYLVSVTAYKIVDGNRIDLCESIVGRVIGRKNAKYTNAKSIKLSKYKYTVNVGSTAKIKAKTVLVDKKKKKLTTAYGKEFRYASSNTNIATVDKNGKIKGVSAGTCIVYIYSRNGFAKAVNVTVK